MDGYISLSPGPPALTDRTEAHGFSASTTTRPFNCRILHSFSKRSLGICAVTVGMCALFAMGVSTLGEPEPEKKGWNRHDTSILAAVAEASHSGTIIFLVISVLICVFAAVVRGVGRHVAAKMAKTAITTLSHEVLGLKVAVRDVRLSIRDGHMEIVDMCMSNPEGYKSRLCDVGECSVDLDVRSTLASKGKLVVVKNLRVVDSLCTVERKSLTSLRTNVHEILDRLQVFEERDASQTEGTQPLRFILKSVDIETIKVRAQEALGQVAIVLPPMQFADLGPMPLFEIVNSLSKKVLQRVIANMGQILMANSNAVATAAKIAGDVGTAAGKVGNQGREAATAAIGMAGTAAQSARKVAEDGSKAAGNARQAAVVRSVEAANTALGMASKAAQSAVPTSPVRSPVRIPKIARSESRESDSPTNPRDRGDSGCSAEASSPKRTTGARLGSLVSNASKTAESVGQFAAVAKRKKDRFKFGSNVSTAGLNQEPSAMQADGSQNLEEVARACTLSKDKLGKMASSASLRASGAGQAVVEHGRDVAGAAMDKIKKFGAS